MSRWFDRLRFLWEEEIPPPEEVPRVDREEPAGVPTPLRGATRFAVIGVVAISLMAQIIGVHLVAPVAADVNYCDRCATDCSHSCAGAANHQQCTQDCEKANCPTCIKPPK